MYLSDVELLQHLESYGGLPTSQLTIGSANQQSDEEGAWAAGPSSERNGARGSIHAARGRIYNRIGEFTIGS
eukprot:1710188-Pyramimonas_sp.AAC.1